MVSVIIATHNNLSCLRECLLSLQRQSFSNLEIIVIFNDSPEGVINEIENYFSKVRCIVNRKNLLFCRAYNQGIDQSKGEYVLCLNDDVVLEQDFIEKLVKVINQDKKIGMVSGKILRMNKTIIDTAGLFLGKNRTPLERGFNQKDKGQYDKDGYIFGVSGCAAFYCREMLEDIKDEHGYFDERYGMFYEDLDLAWRAKRRGWKGYYIAKAVAYHQRGASCKTVMPRISFLEKYNFTHLDNELKVRLIKNRYRTIIKNDSFAGLLFNLPFILVYELKLYLYIIFFSPQLLCRLLLRKDLNVKKV